MLRNYVSLNKLWVYLLMYKNIIDQNNKINYLVIFSKYDKCC